MSNAVSLRSPKYRGHQAKGSALVTLQGRDVYLGKYDSESSKQSTGGLSPSISNTAVSTTSARRAGEATADYPTPEEINQRCEAIQAGWSRKERRFRYLMARIIGSINEVESTYWSAPEMRCVDFCGG